MRHSLSSSALIRGAIAPLHRCICGVVLFDAVHWFHILFIPRLVAEQSLIRSLDSPRFGRKFDFLGRFASVWCGELEQELIDSLLGGDLLIRIVCECIVSLISSWLLFVDVHERE